MFGIIEVVTVVSVMMVFLVVVVFSIVMSLLVETDFWVVVLVSVVVVVSLVVLAFGDVSGEWTVVTTGADSVVTTVSGAFAVCWGVASTTAGTVTTSATVAFPTFVLFSAIAAGSGLCSLCDSGRAGISLMLESFAVFLMSMVEAERSTYFVPFELLVRFTTSFEGKMTDMRA